MLSRADLAAVNRDQARALRAAGQSYREIRRALGLSAAQLAHVRRALKREKAGQTRLRSVTPGAGDRLLPVGRSVLPVGLRRLLVAAGYRTLGDLADRLADPACGGFETFDGIGPHRARLIDSLLDQYGLRPGPSDLQAAIEQLFPELRDE